MFYYLLSCLGMAELQLQLAHVQSVGAGAGAGDGGDYLLKWFRRLARVSQEGRGRGKWRTARAGPLQFNGIGGGDLERRRVWCAISVRRRRRAVGTFRRVAAGDRIEAHTAMSRGTGTRPYAARSVAATTTVGADGSMLRGTFQQPAAEGRESRIVSAGAGVSYARG